MKDRIYLNKTLMNLETFKINVIGAGGTGSHLIDKLSAVAYALSVNTGRKIQLTAIDFDTVSERNVARSKFIVSDVGFSKTQIAISKANLGYGLDWKIQTPDFMPSVSANFNFLCVDDTKTRLEYLKALKLLKTLSAESRPYYVFDVGNDRDFGQVVLLDMDGKFADIDRKGPSSETIGTLGCSTDPFALQGLFINDMMALLTAEMFYRFITDFNLDYTQLYVNFAMMKIVTKLALKNV